MAMKNSVDRVGEPGIGVDARGGAVIDPTKNVDALVRAAIDRVDDVAVERMKRIDAELKHLETIGNLRAEHANVIRNLDSDRLEKIRQVDVVASQIAYDRSQLAIQALATTAATTADTLRNAVTATAATLATQLTSIVAPLTDRVANLEKSSYEGKGRSGVTDPAYSELSSKVDRLLAGADRGGGKSEGTASTWQIIALALAMLVAVLTIYAFLVPKAPQSVIGVEPPPVRTAPVQ